MKSNNYLFSTELIDGSRFRKYNYAYGFLFFLLSGLGYFVFVDFETQDLSIFERINHPYNIGVLLLACISIFLYFYINKMNVKGHLVVYNDEIEIIQNSIVKYLIESLENLEIQRGSTYHYAYQSNNEIVKVGNYLRFKIEGTLKEYEFIIDSKEKNQAFESMINTLQKNRVKIYYTSI